MELTRLEEGYSFEYVFSFSQDDVNKFAEVTHDTNPIHLDETYAAQTVFKKPIVHGFLSGAVFSKVFGTMIPGEGTIFIRQTLAFKRPIYTGEEYVASFEILEIDRKRKQALVSCKILNSRQKVCLDGEATLMHPDRFA